MNRGQVTDVPGFVFAVFTMALAPGLPITAAQQALAPSTSIGSDVIRAVPADILDDIFSFDADKNTASWLGLELRNITVSENPESNQAPYQVTLEADVFDADQGVATLTSTSTFDRMAISITTPDAVFDQTVERDGSGRLIVTSTLTSPAPGKTGTESSLTLTEIVDIDTG